MLRSNPTQCTDDDTPSATDARRIALGLLARREYSRAELAAKLNVQGLGDDLIRVLLGQLIDEGLLSDARFTETWVRGLSGKGLGPVRIRHELRERGVDEATIHAFLDNAGVAWNEIADRERSKRFGSGLPDEYRERARQARFLQQRGFTSEQIWQTLDGIES